MRFFCGTILFLIIYLPFSVFSEVHNATACIFNTDHKILTKKNICIYCDLTLTVLTLTVFATVFEKIRVMKIKAKCYFCAVDYKNYI